MKEKIVTILKWSAGIVIVSGLITFFVRDATPDIVEVDKDGVICKYKDKPMVMLCGEYRRITDAELYVYAIEHQNEIIKVNVDFEKNEKLIMDVNGWYDEDGNYHSIEGEE